MRAALIALAATLALTACETAPPPQYGPATTNRSPGYTESRLEADRFRVSYRTRSGPPARAADLALLRAAQLTTTNGYDWFIVAQRTLEGANSRSSGPRVSFGIGGASFGSHSAVGVGVGTGVNLGEDRGAGAVATLEVRLGRGAKPSDPNAYDARDVQRSLQPAG